MAIRIEIVPRRRVSVERRSATAPTKKLPANGTAVVVVGIPGAEGPAGPPSGFHTHIQAIASALWTVNHNLGRRPIVQVETTGGALMVADVIHISNNTFQVAFDSPSSGVAGYI